MRKRPELKPYACQCGKTFDTRASLEKHAIRVGCGLHTTWRDAVAADEDAVAADVQQHANEKVSQSVREDARAFLRKRNTALRLAELRYLKLIPGKHIDDIKRMHKELNADALAAVQTELQKCLRGHISDDVYDTVITTIEKSFDIYAGLGTEWQELSYLRGSPSRGIPGAIPVPTFHERKLANNAGMAYDFKLDEQLLLLMKHDPRARAQFYDTIVAWRTKPPQTRDDPARILVDITDGAVFLDHPVFGEAQRVSAEQAKQEGATAPMRFAILLYADGFTVCQPSICARPACAHPCLCARPACAHAPLAPCFRRATRRYVPRYPAHQLTKSALIRATRRATRRVTQPVNPLNGIAHMHSTLAILYAIINLHRSYRMSKVSIQVATLCTEHASKLATMYDVINGGTTSIGAQLRVLDALQTREIPNPDGLTTHPREMSVHAVAYTADMPAAASMLAVKGSTSAHRYDRNSTLDQRSSQYGKPFSLLNPDNSPDAFRRITHADFEEWVSRAARETSKSKRTAMLTNVGLNEHEFEFDGKGNYTYKFALAGVTKPAPHPHPPPHPRATRA